MSRLLRPSPTRSRSSSRFPSRGSPSAATASDGPPVRSRCASSRGGASKNYLFRREEKRRRKKHSDALPGSGSTPSISITFIVSPFVPRRSLPALPVSHAVEHAPPLPGGLCTCVRTTSGKPESILIVGTTPAIPLRGAAAVPSLSRGNYSCAWVCVFANGHPRGRFRRE